MTRSHPSPRQRSRGTASGAERRDEPAGLRRAEEARLVARLREEFAPPPEDAWRRSAFEAALRERLRAEPGRRPLLPVALGAALALLVLALGVRLAERAGAPEPRAPIAEAAQPGAGASPPAALAAAEAPVPEAEASPQAADRMVEAGADVAGHLAGHLAGDVARDVAWEESVFFPHVITPRVERALPPDYEALASAFFEEAPAGL